MQDHFSSIFLFTTVIRHNARQHNGNKFSVVVSFFTGNAEHIQTYSVFFFLPLFKVLSYTEKTFGH